MGAQQVLRVAAGLIAALAGAPRPAAAGGVEPVAVIDLRPGDADARRPLRARVTDALRDHAGLWPLEDAELSAALADEPADPHHGEAAAALADAGRAYGALDCPTAAAAADRAIAALAAAQAGGAAVRDELIQAYAYRLLCSADDHPAALTAAARLRALGADPPPGVSAAVWARYPPIDATSNLFVVEVAVASSPAGAALWVDHEPVGVTPLTLHLPEGDHLLAAAAGARATVQRLALRGRARREVALELPAAGDERWRPVREWVAGWRSGERAPTPHDIHGLLGTVDVRVALLLTRDLSRGTDRVEAWGVHPERQLRTALLIGAAAPDELPALLDLVLRTTASWDRGEPTTGGDEPPPPSPDGPERTRPAKPWWVYAAIVGAVALGGAVVLANDLADDKQVIRLRYP